MFLMNTEMIQNDEQLRRSTAKSFILIFSVGHFIMKGSRTKAGEYKGFKISENVFPFQEGGVEVVKRT